MNLDDRYDDQSGTDQRCTGNIMEERSGVVEENNIDEVLDENPVKSWEERSQ